MIQYVADNAQMPRYRSDDAAEKRLAAWVYKMRHLERLGSLPAEREAAIRRAPFRIL